MYTEYEIVQQPLSLRSCRERVERFLAANELRLDDVDYYAVVTRLGEDKILAGGGLSNNIIKCIAVDDSLRGTGMSQRLVSHLLSVAQERGYHSVKVFTKPQNTEIFASLSFKELASSPLTVLMENGLGGIDNYCKYLSSLRKDGNNGVIVMNCNPFTLGHKYLIEQASQQVDNLYVMIVKEDASAFSTTQRLDMARKACANYANVIVCEGSEYSISSLTFPTYFLKKLSDASDTQISLDIDLFARHIASALNAKFRFVGTEPNDKLTARYNELMAQLLPTHGIKLVEIPRKCINDEAVSASTVRRFISEENFTAATKLVPKSTIPYLITKCAVNALFKELSTTPKPGLIDNWDNGAHADMDSNLMTLSIGTLEPYFDKLSNIGFSSNLPLVSLVQKIGIEAEEAMLKATKGVNTHRGALFSLGLTIVGVAYAIYNSSSWSDAVKEIALQIPASTTSHGAIARAKYNVTTALDIAQTGYSDLTSLWLKKYEQLDGDEFQDIKTLLFIMSTLDDTNIIHRVGYDRAQQVKVEASDILNSFSVDAVSKLNDQYIKENISPGGAADMLALTIFISMINK